MATTDEASSALTLYVDFLSQPSRACSIFCRTCALPVREEMLSLRKGDQRNHALPLPLRKIPVLVEGSFVLPESCAILRYLCNTHEAACAGWYPLEPKLRARCDAAMDWHHATLRRGASTLVFLRYFQKVGASAAENTYIKDALGLLKLSLRQLDQYWLKLGGHFVAGTARPTIADLILACEVSQLRLLQAGPPGAAPLADELLAPHPAVREWLAAVQQATEPAWTAVHAHLDLLAAAKL